MHLTFMACLHHDSKFKEEYERACIFDGTYGGFHHFQYFGWHNCDRFTKGVDKNFLNELINKKTKIIKFTWSGCGNFIGTMSREQLLRESTLNIS